MEWVIFLLAGRNQTSKAVVCLTHLAEFEPENGDAHLALGRILAAEGEWQAGAIQFYLGVRYHPDDPQLNYELGAAFIEIGRSEQAFAPLKKAVRATPSMWAAR